MPSRALTFLKEIRDFDRVVVVIGPKCVTSDYCRAEWQAGLAEMKIVNPLLRVGACCSGSHPEQDALPRVRRGSSQSLRSRMARQGRAPARPSKASRLSSIFHLSQVGLQKGR
jgi:hypothetical protein